jgi:hypothetical protein
MERVVITDSGLPTGRVTARLAGWELNGLPTGVTVTGIETSW